MGIVCGEFGYCFLGSDREHEYLRCDACRQRRVAGLYRDWNN